MDRAARKEPCDDEGIVVSKDYPITKIPDSHAEKKKVQDDIEEWLKKNKPTKLKNGETNGRVKGFNNRSNEVNRKRSAAAKRRAAKL